jgi:hypothetical protein
MIVLTVLLGGAAARWGLGQKQPNKNPADSAEKPVPKLMSQPTLKTALYRRGDVLTIIVESATAPDRLYAELTRGGQLKTVQLQFAQPGQGERNGTAYGTMPDDMAFGRWTAEMMWGTDRKAVGSFEIQPPQASSLKLTKLVPDSTYDLDTAYVQDENAKTKKKEFKTANVVLIGSGFQLAKPEDNMLWIDGIRQAGVTWDTKPCSADSDLGSNNKPLAQFAMHGQVISSEQIRLCNLRVASNGSMQLMVGYGDTPSDPEVFRAFNMGRIPVATISAAIALALALLPLALLSSLQRAYRIAGSDYKWRMLFLDPETDTYSLSKLQFYLWTVAALFSYAYLIISKVVVQFASWPDVPASLPGIILVAGGTAVTSQIITATKGSKGAGDEKPSFADFITSGGVVAADRLQMFLWTLFGVSAFLYAVLQLLPGTITDLPAIPDRLMVLMGISSAGYLGGKIARKPGPVIAEMSITPAESDAALALKRAGGESPDLVGPITRAQQALAKLTLVTNANAKIARDALEQAVRSGGAAHTSAEFSHLVTDLEAKCTSAEAAAAAAATDFTAGKAAADEAQTAQGAAAALQEFTADVLQSISLASGGPMQAEEAPPLIARMIELRGTNLSAQALFEIDHADLPFRMMIDKDGKNQPEVVTRDSANPTFASLLRITIDPLRLGDSDQAQFAAWFGNDGHHTFTLINPDGQKSELGFDVPPATAHKVNA